MAPNEVLRRFTEVIWIGRERGLQEIDDSELAASLVMKVSLADHESLMAVSPHISSNAEGANAEFEVPLSGIGVPEPSSVGVWAPLVLGVARWRGRV